MLPDGTTEQMGPCPRPVFDGARDVDACNAERRARRSRALVPDAMHRARLGEQDTLWDALLGSLARSSMQARYTNASRITSLTGMTVVPSDPQVGPSATAAALATTHSNRRSWRGRLSICGTASCLGTRGAHSATRLCARWGARSQAGCTALFCSPCCNGAAPSPAAATTGRLQLGARCIAVRPA
jgi:hypothetical protein